MSMNVIDWIPNLFELEMPEFERQLSNWCNLNSDRKLQIVFDCSDLKKFICHKKLHKSYNGKFYQFYTPNFIVMWNEADENWGFLQKVLSRGDDEKCLYISPGKPSHAGGIAFVKRDV